MNALAHCVEVAWSPHRTPEAEAIALAGAVAHRRRASSGGRRARRPGGPHRHARRRRARRTLPAERDDGRPPRAGPARRRPHRDPPRPGQRGDPAPTPCGSTPRPSPTRFAASAQAIGARRRRGRRDRRAGRPPRPSGPAVGACGVTEDDLDAVAALSAGRTTRSAPTRDRSARPTPGRSSRRPCDADTLRSVH